MRIDAIAKHLLIGIMMIMLISPAIYATEKKEDTPDKEKVDPSKIVETLIYELPEKDKWISDYVHVGNSSRIEIFFPKGQSPDNWKEMITTETVYGKKSSVPGEARLTYLGTVKGSPNATWDILTKGRMEGSGRQFIIYEIICPDFLSGEEPQVQLWKMIGGHTGMFVLQYSYRGKEMPEKRKKEILEVLEKADLKTDPKT